MRQATVAKDNTAEGSQHQQAMWTPDWQLLGAPTSEAATSVDSLGRTVLHYAAAAGKKAAVRQLLAAWPAAASVADTAGQLPIHWAAAAGQAAVVQLLLEAYPAGATTANELGQLPCHEAAKGANVPTLEALLKAAPAAASTPDRVGQLPLHYTIHHLNVDIIRLLLAGADLDAQRCLLLEAVSKSQLEIVRLVMSAAPAAGAADPASGLTALHHACACSSVNQEIVAALLEAAQALAGTASARGQLPLHMVLSGQGIHTTGPAVVRLLLKAHPAAATAPDAAQQLPLATALFRGSREVAELLLAAAPDSLLAVASSSDPFGRTPAHVLAALGMEAPLQQLVGAKPAVLAATESAGALPIHYASRRCQPGCLRLLLAAAPQTALARDLDGQLPLHEAARDDPDDPARATECVRLLLAAAPGSAAAADSEGQLPLSHTLHHGGAEVAAALLAAAPDSAAEAEDDYGQSALVWAVKWQQPGLVRLVLGAVPALASKASAGGMLPLHYQAAYGEDLEVLRLLLEATPGAALAAVEGDGRLPIHLAAEHGRDGAVGLLLKSCPECAEVLDGTGDSPLHWACTYDGGPEVVRLLLAAAPSTAATLDGDGDSPLHCAMWEANVELVPLLLAAAPDMVGVKNKGGDVPLAYGWRNEYKLPERLAAAQQVLAAMGDPAEVLQIIKRRGDAMRPLYADVVGRWQLQPRLWAQVPMECPGLGAALPALVARMDMAGAGQVVRRLPEGERQRLRCAALCLAQAQRALGVSLPFEAVWRILALVPRTSGVA